MKEKLKVAWISAGVSSFVAAYLTKDIDEVIYIDIDNQHPDSLRFIKDCQEVLDKPIGILKSPYRSVDNVIRQFQFISSSYGAKCSEILKRRVRKEWESKHKEYDITYVWGFDTREKNRAERLVDSMPQFRHEFPLMDKSLSKKDCHGVCRKIGVRRPVMYDMGYQNNNCVGCVKGGMWYWNKIRVDFPEVFDCRKKQEREIGHSCIKGIFLDELEPGRGRKSEEISQDCNIWCEVMTREFGQ